MLLPDLIQTHYMLVFHRPRNHLKCTLQHRLPNIILLDFTNIIFAYFHTEIIWVISLIHWWFRSHMSCLFNYRFVQVLLLWIIAVKTPNVTLYRPTSIPIPSTSYSSSLRVTSMTPVSDKARDILEICGSDSHEYYFGVCRSHKSHKTLVPYPTIHHSEQKLAHFCSEWWIVGYGTGALWDLWIRLINNWNTGSR